MNTDTVELVRKEFRRLFKEACEEPLEPDGSKELDYTFDHTVKYALTKTLPEQWDDAARKYVYPKLAEFATRVSLAKDPPNRATVQREARYVIKKYRDKYRKKGIPLVWCDGYPDIVETSP